MNFIGFFHKKSYLKKMKKYIWKIIIFSYLFLSMFRESW